jgi:hypothetical protein
VSGTTSFLTDALGSTVALTDGTGTVQTAYTYEPFGQTAVTGSSSSNSVASSPTFGQPVSFVDPRRAMLGVRLNLGR